MSEFRRIFFSRRMLIGWFIGLFLCGVFFCYECESDSPITLSGEELQQYIDSYPDFLQSVKDNAENAGMLTTVSNHTEFVKDNIEKTLEDYSRLEGIKPVAGENKGIVLFSNFVLGDAIVFFMVIMALLLFAEEKSKGLSALVHSTANGRSKLILERAGILAVTSIVASFLITVVCMLLSERLCGTTDFSRPLQSVPEFSLCAFPITIGEYLLLNIFIKALAAFSGGLLVLFLMIWLEAIPSLLIGAGVLLTEYMVYILLLGTDKLAVFKLVNVIALLRGEIFFKFYYNVNYFGHAIGFLDFSVILIGAAALVIMALSAGFGARCTESGIRIGWIYKIRKWCSLHAPNPPLFFWECRKVFLGQWGIIILAAVLYFSSSTGLEYRYYSFVDADREFYFEKYAGVITEEKVALMQEDYDKLIGKYQENVNEIDYLQENDPENEQILVLMQNCYDLGERVWALQEIIELATGALNYSLETGVETQLVKPDAYERLFVKDINTTNRNSMFLLLGIIGLFSGIMACEKECNMSIWLQTLFRGRKKLLFTKLGVVAFSAPMLLLGVSWAQLYQVSEAVGFNNLDATAQSIPLFREFPFAISIGGYLVLVYALRMFSVFLIGILVVGISALMPNRAICLFICFILLVVPMVLALTGVLNIYSVADLFGVWKL